VLCPHIRDPLRAGDPGPAPGSGPGPGPGPGESPARRTALQTAFSSMPCHCLLQRPPGFRTAARAAARISHSGAPGPRDTAHVTWLAGGACRHLRDFQLRVAAPLSIPVGPPASRGSEKPTPFRSCLTPWAAVHRRQSIRTGGTKGNPARPAVPAPTLYTMGAPIGGWPMRALSSSRPLAASYSSPISPSRGSAPDSARSSCPHPPAQTQCRKVTVKYGTGRLGDHRLEDSLTACPAHPLDHAGARACSVVDPVDWRSKRRSAAHDGSVGRAVNLHVRFCGTAGSAASRLGPPRRGSHQHESASPPARPACPPPGSGDGMESGCGPKVPRGNRRDAMRTILRYEPPEEKDRGGATGQPAGGGATENHNPRPMAPLAGSPGIIEAG
jgi:hypothetical protein